MTDPVVWLGASLLLVAASLALLLVAALPAVQELARAARSAEKLFDMLSRELPPTLEAIRLTGTELANLTDDVSQNVQAAGRVVGQLDQSLSGIKQQAQQAQVATRSLSAGVKAAWQSLTQPRTEWLADESQADELQADELQPGGESSLVQRPEHPPEQRSGPLPTQPTQDNSRSRSLD